MDIKRSNTPAVTAAKELSAILERHKNQPTLLLLSGGSALTMLDHVSETVLSPQLTITTLDERFSTDPQVNNFAQIATTKFYERAEAAGVSKINTSITPQDTLNGAGKRFETALRDWRKQHPHGAVIAIMGVGSDGHTAGIFPGEQEVNFSGAEWTVAYTVPPSTNPYTKRLTVTYTFLREVVTEVLVYVTGEEKQFVLAQLQGPSCDLEAMPACVLTNLKQVTLVTDGHQ